MSAIKPGSLCVIVADAHSTVLGRVCTAVRLHSPGFWEIAAAWLNEPVFQDMKRGGFYVGFGVEERHLRPIDDPSSATNTYTTMVVHV